MDLRLLNKHWKEGYLYNFPIQRALYGKLCSALESRFIISVLGLRRTGKTTLFLQLIDHLISKGIPRQNILLYTFDDPAELEKVINDYLALFSLNLDQGPLYFFLDEIQKLDNWQNKIKIFYDHYPSIKFVVSGSASTFIRKKSESLAGRIFEYTLSPLSYQEYLHFKQKDSWLKQPQVYAPELQRELEGYARRQFIEIIGAPEDTVKAYMDSIARKVIFEDIPLIYPIEQPQVLWKIFKLICSNPGMLLDYHNFSSDLGINEKTMANYIEFLENAFLITKLYNYSANQLTSERKLKKVYPCASSFCDADQTKVMETIVVTQLHSQFFWNRGHEVDCIMTNGKIIPLEVKYKSDINQRELKGMATFMEKFSVSKGIVASKDLEKEEKNLLFIPIWKLLLNQELYLYKKY